MTEEHTARTTRTGTFECPTCGVRYEHEFPNSTLFQYYWHTLKWKLGTAPNCSIHCGFNEANSHV